MSVTSLALHSRSATALARGLRMMLIMVFMIPSNVSHCVTLQPQTFLYVKQDFVCSLVHNNDWREKLFIEN